MQRQNFQWRGHRVGNRKLRIYQICAWTIRGLILSSWFYDSVVVWGCWSQLSAPRHNVVSEQAAAGWYSLSSIIERIWREWEASDLRQRSWSPSKSSFLTVSHVLIPGDQLVHRVTWVLCGTKLSTLPHFWQETKGSWNFMLIACRDERVNPRKLKLWETKRKTVWLLPRRSSDVSSKKSATLWQEIICKKFVIISNECCLLDILGLRSLQMWKSKIWIVLMKLKILFLLTAILNKYCAFNVLLFTFTSLLCFCVFVHAFLYGHTHLPSLCSCSPSASLSPIAITFCVCPFVMNNHLNKWTYVHSPITLEKKIAYFSDLVKVSHRITLVIRFFRRKRVIDVLPFPTFLILFFPGQLGGQYGTAKCL